MGAVSVEPSLYCEGNLDFLCVHGSFTIGITGRISARSGPAQLAFVSPIIISGTLCGETQ